MENLQISIVSLEVDRQDNLFLTDYTSSILPNLHAMFSVGPFRRRSICMNLDILDTRSSVLKALAPNKFIRDPICQRSSPESSKILFEISARSFKRQCVYIGIYLFVTFIVVLWRRWRRTNSKKERSTYPSHDLSGQILKNSKYTYRYSSCTKKTSALNSKYAYSASLTSQNAYSFLPFSRVVQTLLPVLHHSTIHFLNSFFATIISSWAHPEPTKSRDACLVQSDTTSTFTSISRVVMQ